MAGTGATLGLRRFKRSNITVSELGFGAAPLGDLYDLLDEETAISAAATAIDNGINLLDTSPLYGHGLAEARIGAALRRSPRRNVVLSTKVGRWMSPAVGLWDREGYAGGLPFSATIDYSYDGAFRSLEQSLLRLGVSKIDILLIHDIDRRNHGDAFEQRFDEAVSGAWRALSAMKEQGMVSAIGIGVNEADVCVRFAERCDLDCVLLAGCYSLLDQSAAEEFLPMAQARGIDVLAAGVFSSGILATGAVAGARYRYAVAPEAVLQRVRKLEAVCTRHGVALPTAAIHFARLHPAHTSVVLGAVTQAEVRRNLESWSKPPPEALWADLVAEGLLPVGSITRGQTA
jgi:D-threo-aldose 1-dehydrogenase